MGAQRDDDHGWGELGGGLARSPLPTLLESLDPCHVLATNAAVHDLLGCAPSALAEGNRGPLRHTFCDEADHDLALDAARAAGGRATREIACLRCDGTPVPCRVTVEIVGGSDRPRAIWFLHDLRPEQAAWRAQSITEANLSALVENTDDLIAAYDREVRLIVFNEACARAYQALLGVTLCPGLRTIELFPEEMRGFWQAANARALGGEVFSIELELPSLVGDPRLFESSYNPIRREGEVVGFSTFTRDITARRRAEQDRGRFEARLRQTRKMEAVGTLAGGLAHDFNNLLHVIAFSACEAIELSEPSLAVRDLLRSIVATTERGAELTRRLTRFARPSEEGLVPLDLGAITSEALRLLRRSVAAAVAVDFDPGPDPVRVLGNEAELHQAVINLGLNAAQAMPPDGGRLRVSVAIVTLDEGGARDLDLAAGAYARLSVVDTGHGMDEATLARMFDPFFSTRPRDRHSGLGLTMVQSVVRGHHGAVRTASRPGEGARFEIFLPVTTDEEARPAPAEPQATPTCTGRVLLVDDDPWGLAAMDGWLSRVGFTVTAYERSAEAWAAFERDPDAWDVVVTDVIMPAPTGTELLQRMIALRPATRVVLLSGYAGDLTAGAAKGLGAAAFLAKPVDRDALLRALSEPR